MAISTPTPGKGRPRTFDRDAVLDSLVQLFWQQGFEATSMNDIVEASGLNKSSLYNAFGSKDVLFQQALDRYVDQRLQMVGSVLTDGTQGLADIHTLLDLLMLEAESSGGNRGCLAVNSSTELGLRDPSVVIAGSRYRDAMRSAFHAAFIRAADRGEIRADLTDTYASVMLTMLLGVAVMVRSGAELDELRAQVAAGRTMLDTWRI